MIKPHHIDYYTKQGKFYPVNGIGTIEDVTQEY
jgi:adenylate kinase family enzyme